jgi:transcriptional regulator with XRE-family HTH domain
VNSEKRWKIVQILFSAAWRKIPAEAAETAGDRMEESSSESDIIEQLRQAIRESGLALAEIARRCGEDPEGHLLVDHPRLSRFVRGERSLTFETAALVASVLRLRLVKEERAEGVASAPGDEAAQGGAAQKERARNPRGQRKKRKT